MTPDALASKIIADCKRDELQCDFSNDPDICTIIYAQRILNAAKPAAVGEIEHFMGFKFIQTAPRQRKTPWRMFPQFLI